jgi:uncharacterized protein YndB with AHSA1/START domain
MEQKTKLSAEEARQEIVITREFDLPLELLFKAYEEPELVEQWMGTKVIKLENRQHGSWQFETSDPSGNVVFQAHGVIHEFVPGKRFTRTFEMVGVPFGIQLEFFEFEKLSEERSKLTMHIVFKSIANRDQMLQIPFAQGLNMAHNRLQEIVNNLK